ncbi:aldehyde dehydrogenase family protein [Marinobacterium mangrovicola]|uniref:Phenylacetaldehyde dehydrogenase n=1 Tax=Marinobacterium mangrovicola TaxID=1476959 RepID=A0A4R1GD79_9GAMM|nr:aldehyde dehydrogenase family protein [Marinobacterium mangrovicola]TCK04803.1 phenylacetaldehyde dehydrogenase [Marinobacterium mangrovicola]
MSQIEILDSVKAYLLREHGQFIAGEASRASDTAKIDLIDPATEQPLAQVASASTAELDAAVASAKRAFKGEWAQKTPYERGQLINRFADLIEANGEELAQLETLCSGKSIHLSRMLEVQQSAMSLRYYAGWATKIAGETLTPSFPSMQGERYSAMTRREPVGVVAGIIPWNFSVMIANWKIGAALATGCTIVLKPSEFTPLTLLRLAELAIEAGIPAGVINVLNGEGAIGQQLIEHPDVAKVSFTGSVPTGMKVGQTAMAANLTRCTLELGGKNAAALLADADIDRAVGGLLQTGYVHQGQVCAAPERVFVHRSRIDELTSKLAAGLSQAKIGSPLDESVMFGPISNKPQFDKVCHYLEQAKRESRIVCGGNALDRAGYFVEPTIVQASSASETLMREETFGPVISFMPYDDESELLGLINDSPFGLSASVWTNDLSKAMRMIPEIEAGTVWVNMHTFVDPSVPFGGLKSSGLGREFGSAFIEDYTELKSVMLCY